MNYYRRGANVERAAVTKHAAKNIFRCSKCREYLPKNRFHRDRLKKYGIRYKCAACASDRTEKELQDLRHYSREMRKTKKRLVLKGYGSKCACCGEKNPKFLTIDHIAGGGRKHRRKLGGQSYFYTFLIKNNFPKGYQIMCMNCNFAKGVYRKCPHAK